MKSLLKYFICVLCSVIFFAMSQVQGFCASHPVKTIAVMTDTSHRNGTSYLICGAAADIFATDIINRINTTGRMKAPVLGETMSKITQQNIPLYYVTFLNEYKYNYNIDFVNLKRITKNLQADYVLMITSGLDVQSQFLKDTWWNKLNVPGMDPVRPTYKLSTLITLIDTKTYNIVWQDMYLRDIEAHNYDLGIVQFSPSYAQLSKIKKYSKNMSEYVTNIIDKQVNPWIVPPEEPKSVEMKYKFLNEGTKVYYPTVNGEVVKENFNEFKTEKQKQWNEFQQKRQQYFQQKQQNKIQNVNYTAPANSSTVVKQIAVPSSTMNYSAPSAVNYTTPANANYSTPVGAQSTNYEYPQPQNYNNLNFIQRYQKEREEAKLQKTMQQQILQQQKEEQKFIQKHKKDKQLFDSIRNNIEDVSNNLPAPKQNEQFLLPVEEEAPSPERFNGYNLKLKELNPELYKKTTEHSENISK